MKGHIKTTSYLKTEIYKIAQIVAYRYDMSIEDIYGTSRIEIKVFARQMVWKIARELYGGKISYSELGELFSHRTHSTVLLGIRTISDLIDTDRHIYKDYKEILRQSRVKLNYGQSDRDENKHLREWLRKILWYKDMVNARIEIRSIMKRFE